MDKNCYEFCIFSLPMNADLADLVMLRPHSSPKGGQCCSVEVRNDQAGPQHCFLFFGGRGGGGGGVFVTAYAFKSFILIHIRHGNFCSKL